MVWPLVSCKNLKSSLSHLLVLLPPRQPAPGLTKQLWWAPKPVIYHHRHDRHHHYHHVTSAFTWTTMHSEWRWSVCWAPPSAPLWGHSRSPCHLTLLPDGAREPMVRVWKWRLREKRLAQGSTGWRVEGQDWKLCILESTFPTSPTISDSEWRARQDIPRVATKIWGMLRLLLGSSKYSKNCMGSVKEFSIFFFSRDNKCTW